jgi:Phage integrase, N-terminal SAM-like domain
VEPSSGRARYLPHARASKRSWNTDEALLRIHILPAIGRFALDEITSEHIADLVTEMRSKGYTAGTTNRVLALLSHVFNLDRSADWVGTLRGMTIRISRKRALSQARSRRKILWGVRHGK